MSAYVLDASVAAKWLLPSKDEPLAAEAAEILRGYVEGRNSFLVPDLFWPEVGNILWKAARAGRMTANSAEAAIAAVKDQRFPTVPSLQVLDEAFVIAQRFERTVYDSMYVALALTSNRILLTADERLANSLGGTFPIRWLGSAYLP